MKQAGFRVTAAILTFLIGMAGLRAGGAVSSLWSSRTPLDFPSRTAPPLKAPLPVESAPASVGRQSNRPTNAETETGVFNPSGDYHPLHRPADESEKFVHFHLRTERHKGKSAARGTVKGVGRWYKFASVSVTERSLRFSTAIIDGVKYRFEGRFLVKGDFAGQSAGQGIVALEGRLKKFVDGRKVLEISTSFVYYPGC